MKGALLFNSGFNANIGFFQSVAQRGDIILYDELVHASIRDGIIMSNAKAYKFRHNDIKDLNHKLVDAQGEVYVVTESVFSMDGDTPDLKSLAVFCQKNALHLVVDEAHAVGLFNRGLVAKEGIQHEVFARIVTFGKAMGSHGAAILGCADLKAYLINFARSFIYTTAMPPHSAATVLASFQWLQTVQGQKATETMQTNINYFKNQLSKYGLKHLFLPSQSAIQIAVIGGNSKTKQLALKIQDAGFDVRPILSPTVAKGKERLRICLHAFNTEKQIRDLLEVIQQFHG